METVLIREKNKKKYQKPGLKKVAIDKDISLVMLSEDGDPPPGPFTSNNYPEEKNVYKPQSFKA